MHGSTLGIASSSFSQLQGRQRNLLREPFGLVHSFLRASPAFIFAHMSSIPPLRAARGCASCRTSALRLFLGGMATPRAARPSVTSQPHIQAAARFSTFRQTPPLRKGPAIVEHSEAEARENEESGGAEVSGSNGDQPWYLEVEPPKHPTLVDHLPPLPDVPADSPQLMGPLLKYVSEDLGLDELNLLDLRTLDPPPALGPGLIMLFGTARSERHLHVSADRLVRWLRGRGITSDADGLLGRNELKIRLRRKARKAKMLGNSSRGRDMDDGISTGWICVNLGTIGWSEGEAEIVGDDGKVTGFGVPQTGTTIVVQMFTESRRAELDLEAFWTKLAQRSEEKQAIQDGTKPRRKPESRPRPRPTDPVANPFLDWQKRAYSTTCIRQSPTEAESALAEKVQAALANPNAISEIADVLVHNTDEKLRLLEQMKSYIGDQPTSSVVQALRRGELSEGGKPSAFLRLFDIALANLSPAQTWSQRLWLHTTARNLGLMEYDLKQLADLVEEMRVSGINATQDQCADIIRAIFAQPGQGDGAVREQARLAMQVIDTMHERGLNVLSHDVIVATIDSLVRSGSGGDEANRLRSTLEFLQEQASLPYMGEKHILSLLDAYASEENWDQFWKTWRIPPRFEVARSPQMYSYLFQRFADTQHQSLCIDAIRWCFQEMVNEEPPVQPRGPVLDALKACISVADPQAEAIAANVVVKDRASELLANREFVKLLQSITPTH